MLTATEWENTQFVNLHMKYEPQFTGNSFTVAQSY